MKMKIHLFRKNKCDCILNKIKKHLKEEVKILNIDKCLTLEINVLEYFYASKLIDILKVDCLKEYKYVKLSFDDRYGWDTFTNPKYVYKTKKLNRLLTTGSIDDVIKKLIKLKEEIGDGYITTTVSRQKYGFLETFSPVVKLHHMTTIYGKKKKDKK